MEKKVITASDLFRFLLKYPPFYYLPKVDLDEMVEKVEQIGIKAGEYLFEEGAEYEPYAYVLRDGHIEILKKFEDNTQVIDVAQKGDVLGARAVLTQKPYLGTARATRKSSLVRIPEAIFIENLERNPRVALFFARGFAAGRPLIHEEEDVNEGAGFHFLSRDPVLFMRTEDVLIPNPVEHLLKGPGATTLGAVAQMMKEHSFGSFLIVDDAGCPLGIATESDFIRRGAEHKLSWESPVSEIMSSPVRTIPKGATAAQLIIAMTRHKIDHLVVTEDGTDQTAVTGIISQRDILLMHGNNPAVLVRQLQEAPDVPALVRIRKRADELIYNYLRQEVSIPFIAEVVTEINDTLLRKAISFSIRQLEKDGLLQPEQKFCWLALGSEGRREQLRRTDQDNAIVYENPPPESEQAVRDYYERLGHSVVQILLEAGFARCPGDIMASNPKWVQPLSTWKQYFTDWIALPNSEALLSVSIFFDLRSVFGDEQLTEALSRHIFETIEGRTGFLQFFAQSALRHPTPLSFFGRFILESEGDKKDGFDLKARAMRPLDHAARVLVHANGIRGVTNTVKRYESLSAILPDAKLFREASMAYEILMRYRGINGFRNDDSGRYIYPKQLTKIERETLKTCFGTVERVQSYIKTIFGVS